MAHWIRALSDLAEDLGLVLSSHFWHSQLSMIQVLGNQMPSTGLTGLLRTCAGTYTHTHKLILKPKSLNY